MGLRFIDLFAGIGGIRLAWESVGGECVFSSEWDKFAARTYAANYGETPQGDITQIAAEVIPAHDVLLAGFPCQAFSNAGQKRGFMDTRGTMFFEIQRILAHHRPAAFMLENVKQLRGHDQGRTLDTILKILRGEACPPVPEDVPMSAEARRALSQRLNYAVDYRVLKATDFGLPQKRERIFIVGVNRDRLPGFGEFHWPQPPEGITTRLGDVLEEAVGPQYTLSQRMWDGHQRRRASHRRRGNGFGFGLFTPDSPSANTLTTRYYKDGGEVLIDQSHLGKAPRRLTPRECARLQGFPDSFRIDAVSDMQAYKQFGNTVPVPVVRAVAQALAAHVQRAAGEEAA